MAKCPSCKKEIRKPDKTWKYGTYTVQAYHCSCGTEFRDYAQKGIHRFRLKLEKGKGYRKA